MNGEREIMLQATGIALAFGGVRAVAGADLTVHANEIYAIIGPNGAGKTSMFNALSGFFFPDAGTVHFRGQDVTRLANWKRIRLGMSRTFQTPSIFPELSVVENMMIGVLSACSFSQRFRLLGKAQRRRVEDRIAELIGFVGLERLRDTHVVQLSHGDQRLVEIAMSLSTDPKMILLDEPTAGLPEAETTRVMGIVRDLHARLGLTVLFVEHNMRFVSQLAHTVTVMNRGSVLCTGKPAMVLSDPAVRKAYLGSEEVEALV